MRKLPVTWSSNRTAWMNSTLLTNWLNDFDKMMQKQNRRILLFLDNAPVHPPDVILKNITLKFFPANTTATIQPMDQGVIRTFKAYYRRQRVQHVIANASTAFTADDVRVTALDAVYCIDAAWKSITETTLCETFKKAGFEKSRRGTSSTSIEVIHTAEDIDGEEPNCVEQLDNLLRHVSIDGETISANDFIVRSYD